MRELFGKHLTRTALVGAVSGLLLCGVTSAQAQLTEDAAEEEGEEIAEEAPAEEEPAEEESLAEEDAAASGGSSADGGDGVRFRFAVAAGAGPMSSNGLSFTYTGVDLRFGAQINDMIGVYGQPQFGAYFGGIGGFVGSGGLMGGTGGIDFTFIDRFFVGGGVGYAVLNNPGGPVVHLRAGGYPLMKRSKDKVRRKGLMLGVDFRLHFVAGYTFVAPTFNIGYEAF